MISVEIWAHSSQLIHALVTEQGKSEWMLTAIYGSPKVEERGFGSHFVWQKTCKIDLLSFRTGVRLRAATFSSNCQSPGGRKD